MLKIIRDQIELLATLDGLVWKAVLVLRRTWTMFKEQLNMDRGKQERV